MQTFVNSTKIKLQFFGDFHPKPCNFNKELFIVMKPNLSPLEEEQRSGIGNMIFLTEGWMV